MSKTIAEEIWEEGRLKGQAEGKLEGELEGERRALRQTLRRLLAERFESVPDAVLQRIDHVTDVDSLMKAAVQVLHVATPEELKL